MQKGVYFMSNNTHTSFSDIAVNSSRLGKNICYADVRTHKNGIKYLIPAISKLGSVIIDSKGNEIETSTIMYEDNSLWLDSGYDDDNVKTIFYNAGGLKLIRADEPLRQWEYCQKYDKSNKNKCDCYKMEWHGKENGRVCNHIVKRCNSVIKQPQKKAKSWNGSKDRWITCGYYERGTSTS